MRFTAPSRKASPNSRKGGVIIALIKGDAEKETLKVWRTYTAVLEKFSKKLKQDFRWGSHR
jgi:hypothetical protein